METRGNFGSKLGVILAIPKLNGKKVALFGSYGWGECDWMRDWESDAKDAGAVLISEEGLTVNETPEGDACDACKEYGKKIAQA